ncbi:MAG: hypothetical protein IM638_19615 [Bacteroidetes bacterium]|nr:hypothetical protein [Bacteroidota bacterium]
MEAGQQLTKYELLDARMFGGPLHRQKIFAYVREQQHAEKASVTPADSAEEKQANVEKVSVENEQSHTDEEKNTATQNSNEPEPEFVAPLNPAYVEVMPAPLLNEWEMEMEGDNVVVELTSFQETNRETQPAITDPLAEERKKINPKTPLTPEQKIIFNWDNVRKQFAAANAPIGVKLANGRSELTWTELDRWTRMALKDGWKEGDKIPLLRDVKYLGDKEGIPRYAALNYDYAFGYARKNSPNGKFWYVNHTTGYEAPIWSGTKLSSNEAGQNYALNINRTVDFKALNDFVKPQGEVYFADIIALNGQYKAQLYSQSFVDLVYLVQMKLFPLPEEKDKRTGIYDNSTHEQFIHYAENQKKKEAQLTQQIRAEELRWATVGEDDGNGYRKYIIEGRALRIKQEELDKFRKIIVENYRDSDEFFENYSPPDKQEKEDLAYILTFHERTQVIAAYAAEWDVDKEEEAVINLLLRNTPPSQHKMMSAYLKQVEKLADFSDWFDNAQQIGEYQTNRELLTGEVNTSPLDDAYNEVDLSDDAEDAAEDLNDELPKLSPGQIAAFDWGRRMNLLEIFLQESPPKKEEDWNYFGKLFSNTPANQLTALKLYLGIQSDYVRMLRLRERTTESQKKAVNDSMNNWYANDNLEYYFLKELADGNKHRFGYEKIEPRLYGLPESVYNRLTDEERMRVYEFVIHRGLDNDVEHEYAIGILERILHTVGTGATNKQAYQQARQAFYDKLDTETDKNFSNTNALANTDEKRELIHQQLSALDARGRKARIEEVHRKMGTPEKGINNSADDYIARLSDEDMQALGILQRFNMIRAVLGGDGWGRAFTRVGERDEKTLIRLVSTTPHDQMNALILLLSTGGGEYYKQVVHAVDGNEYKELHDTLLQKKQEQMSTISDPKQKAAEQRKVQDMKDTGQSNEAALKWDDYSYIGLVFGGSGFEYDVSWTEDGKINVEYGERNWLDGYSMAYTTIVREGIDAADKETQKGPYNPFDHVAVYAVEDDEELGLYKGQVLVMPAINLFYFQHKQLKGHALEALDIALLLTGIGELNAAVSFGRWIMAASTIILGSGNIVVRSFGHQLPEGWAQSWHSISSQIINFQLFELGLAGILNARRILTGLKQSVANVANVAKNTLLQMVNVCEQLLDLSERILTSFDELWLNQLLADLEKSTLEFAEYGSLAYFNLKTAIQNRLALLKEHAARLTASKPFEESQLTYRQAGDIEYLDVDLGKGMVAKLRRDKGGEWFVSGRKAPPEMYNTSKGPPKWPSDGEILGRVPERFRKPNELKNDNEIINKTNSTGSSNTLNKITPKSIDEIRDLLKTDRDKSFFWSGKTNGVGGEKVALEIANSKGGVTLEGLLVQKNIELPAWNPTDPIVMKLWEDVSTAYANQVSGEVRAVIGQQLRPGNIWQTKELPALMANPNVTKITTIDPVTLAETIIFVKQ